MKRVLLVASAFLISACVNPAANTSSVPPSSNNTQTDSTLTKKEYVLGTSDVIGQFSIDYASNTLYGISGDKVLALNLNTPTDATAYKTYDSGISEISEVVFDTPSKTLWVAGKGGFAQLTNSGDWKKQELKGEVKSLAISDSKNVVVVSLIDNHSRVMRYQISDYQLYPRIESWPGEIKRVRCIGESTYFITGTNKVMKLKPDFFPEWLAAPMASSTPDNSLIDLEISESGDPYILRDKAVMTMSSSGNLDTLKVKNLNESVYDFVVDKNEQIWITTGSRISRFSIHGKLTTIDLEGDYRNLGLSADGTVWATDSTSNRIVSIK